MIKFFLWKCGFPVNHAICNFIRKDKIISDKVVASLSGKNSILSVIETINFSIVDLHDKKTSSIDFRILQIFQSIRMRNLSCKSKFRCWYQQQFFCWTYTYDHFDVLIVRNCQRDLSNEMRIYLLYRSQNFIFTHSPLLP